MSEIPKEYTVLFNGITTLKNDVNATVSQLRQLQQSSEEAFVENSESENLSKEYLVLFNGINSVVEMLNRLCDSMDNLQLQAEDVFLAKEDSENKI